MYQYLRGNLRYDRKVKVGKDVLLSKNFDKIMDNKLDKTKDK